MEIILELLKYLTTSLTPVEFLAVMVMIGFGAFFVAGFAQKKRRALMALFGKGEDEAIKAISRKLDSVVTRDELQQHLAKFELIIRHELSVNSQSLDSFKEKYVEISSIRNEIVDKEFERVLQEIFESRQLFTAKALEAAEQREIILTTTSRIQDAQHRVISEVEKVDEYLRAAIPEFRAYHREIDNDVKLLSRDLALIERSIQMSLNTGAGVKLR